MISLCVDTSSREIGMGLFCGDRILCEQYIPAQKRYNSALLPMISDLLKKSGTDIKQIDVFAATLGPGSFTGIRVGMAAMKGFAQALDKPFFGLSTLEILAGDLGGQPGWAVLDAGRGEVYAAYFKRDGGSLAQKGGFILESMEKFAARVKKGAYVASLACEDTGEKLCTVNPGIMLIKAAHVRMRYFNDVMLTRGDIMDKKRLYTAAPVYIRPSEAEVVLKKARAAVRKQKRADG